jgi:very-short-patch-repair endonuclease
MRARTVRATLACTISCMTRPARPLPEHVRHETMSTAEARARGVAVDRLRRADVVHPFHGVVMMGGRPRSIVDRAWAYTQVMPASGWFSHSTAALLLGLPVPRAREQGPLHVTVGRGSRAPRGAGLVGHQRELPEPSWSTRLMATSTRELVPLRVATPGAAALTTASLLSLPDLVALIDALRLVDEPSALRDIDRMLERSARRAGAAALRRALALSEPGVRSRAETHLRLTLAAAGLPRAHVAPAVATPLGDLHPDLAWPEFRVLVEYEGDHHRTDARQFASDLARFDAFADAGWHPIRATKGDVYESSRRIVSTVARRLRAAGWRSRRPVRHVPAPIAIP